MLGEINCENKMRVRPIALAVTFACALSSNASADPIAPLTYSTLGVVGTFDGKLANANESSVMALAQLILDLGLNAQSPAACIQCRTSEVVDYSGKLSNPIRTPENGDFGGSSGQTFIVSSEYEYVIAKYDGQNGGYVLFHVPTFGNELPRYPDIFWTSTGQYAISNFTTFDSTSVPDGGATAALLGSALFAVGFLRGRFRKSSQS
jgi:hypothetical protein